jgi:type VI secretion system secreted protein VgrG
MALKIEQAGRALRVQAPVDDPDDLILVRVAGSEGLSRPFGFVADFLSPKTGIAPAKLLGKGMGLMIFGAANTTRLVNGRVSHWAELGPTGTAGLTRYRAELVPTFSLLSLSSDCRTFENRTVQDIVETIFKAHGFKEFRFSLTHPPTPTIPYVVQYQESDFAFVSRLLEDHGLHYCFEHQLDKHVLVITDRLGSVVPEGVLTPLAVAPFKRKSLPDIPGVGPPGKAAGDAAGKAVGSVVGSILGPLGTMIGGAVGGAVGGEVSTFVEGLIDRIFGGGTEAPPNGITELLREHRVHTKTMAARDFHLLRAADSDSAPSSDPGVRGEHFEFLGDLSGTPKSGVATVTTKQRMEVEEAGRDLLRGSSTACPLMPGTRVVISGGVLGTSKPELHLTEVAHVAESGNVVSGENTPLRYVNEFVAMPAATQYRPERKTPHPSVRGTQTAQVVGEGGAGQIDVDANGCVLLEYPWDRGDGKDGKSQHRVHVASFWSGTGWGAIHLPRIGQLVLVEFLEGDPDRPIITGRVYSREHAHPYALPANKTQSGIKSRTMGGGDANFNELRFEDKKGSEHINVQAEKDLHTLVKNNETRSVGADRTVTVQHFDHLEVKDGEHKMLITKGNQIILAHEGDQFVRVGTGNQDLSVKEGNQSIATLDGNQTVDVNGDQTTTVTKGDRVISVKDGDNKLTVETGQLALRALNDDLLVHADIGDIKVNADAGKILIEAAQELEIKVGACKLSMKADGTFAVNGVQVKISGAGQVEIKGAMTKIAGDGMLQLKSPLAQVNGDGMLMAKGGVTMIN